LFRVVDEIDRIDGLIKGLLNFARPPKPHFMSTDVNAVLEGAVQLVMRQGTRKGSRDRTIDVVKDYAPDLPEIVADAMQLRQVFMNILMNAVDALPAGGTVTVRTSCLEPAGAISVSISDTGRGMDADERDKVFQPFFTTKTGGTGLGLAISKRLIEEQGGAISLQSSMGSGTTFTVTIPRERRKEAGA
jgi:two-component system sensor histidine kinase AtoS